MQIFPYLQLLKWYRAWPVDYHKATITTYFSFMTANTQDTIVFKSSYCRMQMQGGSYPAPILSIGTQFKTLSSVRAEALDQVPAAKEPHNRISLLSYFQQLNTNYALLCSNLMLAIASGLLIIDIQKNLFLQLS